MRHHDLETIRGRYQRQWLEHGPSPKALGWCKGRQFVRFAVALEGMGGPELKRVLDVGCGFGDLFGFLRARKWRGRYHGVDIVPEFIAEARRRYASPRAKFDCLDIAGLSAEEPYTMACALGVFNHKLEQDNMEFIAQVMAKMWQLTTGVIVLDFLSSAADIQRTDHFYSDPLGIYRLARRFSRRISINHAYMPFEFQVKIWHDDAFTKEVPVFSPYLPLVTR
jgi:SAM-dependent methyltransferase